MIEVKRNWLIFFGSAVFVMTLSAFTTGCRFGNRVEGGGPQQDSLAGFYETAPKSVEFCATLASGTKTCKDGSAALIPPFVRLALSNPVNLQWQDKELGEAWLISKDDDRIGLPIMVSGSTTHSYIGNTTPRNYNGATCKFQMWLDSQGVINQAGEVTSAGVPYGARGRLSYQGYVEDIYSGDCVAAMQADHDCYLDANQCGQDTSAANEKTRIAMQAYYEPYIQSGAITVGEIPQARKLRYTVFYE